MAGKISARDAGAHSKIAGFSLSKSEICAATDHCLRYMDDALKQKGGTQIPSFVTSIPNGSETGVFLTVDLGGTNCRVCAVELHGNSTYTMKQSKYAIPRVVMVNQRHEPLFDFIADRIASFLEENPEVDAKNEADSAAPTSSSIRKLGFTFSFTYDSHSASHGTMLQWDKGWDIPDAIGRDPCHMLQNAIDRQKLHVRVAALTNDSVGTLMAKAYTSADVPSPLIGAIFGTGTNAAYVEDLPRIEKLPPVKEIYQGKDSIMVINTEWGAWFDSTPCALPSCIYDHLLDEGSLTPGEQLFEKRTSGLYLGELARLAICDLVSSNQIQMTIKATSRLQVPYSVSTSFLSTLAEGFDDPKAVNWQSMQKHISKSLIVENVSTRDAQILSELGAAIVKRAAQLAGATIAAIIIHSGKLAPVLTDNRRKTTSKWRKWHEWNVLSCVMCHFGQSHSHDDTATLESDTTLNMPTGHIDIGIDGSLFEYYPKFEDQIRNALRSVPRVGADGEARVKIGLAKDGSSLGAALIAHSVP